ncbi:LytTR family DNA-binding domain-containing protein [Longitalea arenae]|uniref:LytTR family DNA-binding domain-containing protein n=1 Tax=Longitalea arenae TaxID=2812558 RepID=UPI001967E5CB|nr:LytTR family DNA-binding domain-containing protein [Longitalea arenae]
MLKPFFVWQNKILKNINPAEVMCLLTEGNYTKIILSNKSYFMVRSSLSSALKKLPTDIFIKTHRSIAASIYFIDNVSRDHLTVGGEPIPIARQYYKRVIDQLNIIE